MTENNPNLTGNYLDFYLRDLRIKSILKYLKHNIEKWKYSSIHDGALIGIPLIRLVTHLMQLIV